MDLRQKDITLGVSLGALIAAGSIILFQIFGSKGHVPLGNEDDRPPIIVSNGSLLIQSMFDDRNDGTQNSRGQFIKDTNLTFHHAHDKGKPGFFLVAVNDGTGTGCDAPVKASQLIITYSAALGAKGHVTVMPGAKGATFTFDKDSPNLDSVNPYRLVVGGLIGLNQVDITDWKANTEVTTCTFAGASYPLIEIRQKK